MKRIVGVSVMVLGIVLLMGGSALAVKPDKVMDHSNGFPSGDHYNLNIIGKKQGFNCMEQEVDTDGNTIYGNVVFIPEKDVGEIYMQSGKGKRAEAITQLQVTDRCADSNGAWLQLPKNDSGYRVYARALAKPQKTLEGIGLGIESSLVPVEDENGTDLVYLGLVTNTGFRKAGASFTRQKGKSTAIPITDLFQWSGTVCHLSVPEGDSAEAFDPGYVCCTQTDTDTGECVQYDWAYNADGELQCIDPVTVYCMEYKEEWVFNIGDFVTYLWETDNNGTKLLQVRFYPN